MRMCMILIWCCESHVAATISCRAAARSTPKHDSGRSCAAMLDASQCLRRNHHVCLVSAAAPGRTEHLHIMSCKHTYLVQASSPPSPALVTAWMAAMKQTMTAEATKPPTSHSRTKALAEQLICALLTALNHVPADCATIILERLADLAMSHASGRLQLQFHNVQDNEVPHSSPVSWQHCCNCMSSCLMFGMLCMSTDNTAGKLCNQHIDIVQCCTT